MKVFEGKKKARLFKTVSGLSIASVINAGNSIEAEARQIKAALLAWQQRHGKDCRDLNMVFTADESQHGHILEYMEAALNHDVFMSEFRNQLAIELVFLNLRGEKCREFQLSGPS